MTDVLFPTHQFELRSALGRRPLLLRHQLTGHPALTRQALASVAESHPAHLVEHHLGDLPLVCPTGEALQLPLSAREVIEGIDGNHCWMVLWALGNVAPYDTLVEEWLRPVRAAMPCGEGPLGPSASLALIASPEAVVPAHVDNTHNVLVQLEGTKEVSIGEFSDRSEGYRQVELRYGPSRLNLDRLPDIVTTFTLGPGDALYIPPYSIHWVIGGTDSSVAVSCSFASESSRRAQEVYACNARLRRLGLRPRPPGERLRIDQAKVGALHCWATLRRARAGAQRRLRRGHQGG